MNPQCRNKPEPACASFLALGNSGVGYYKDTIRVPLKGSGRVWGFRVLSLGCMV